MPREPAAAEFLRTADLLPDALLLLDAQGRLLTANRTCERLLGRTRQELTGLSLQDLATDAARVQALLSQATRTRDLLPAMLELRQAGGTLAVRSEGALYQPADGGQPALVLLRLTPRADASARFIALSRRIEALTEEIGRRRRVEAALFEERERLRVTLASIGDAVIVTDTDGRVTFMNQVAEDLTGWPGEEALGRPLDEVFVIVNHDTREPVESPVRKVLREGVIVGLANHTVLLRRGGSIDLPIDDSGAPVRDDKGRLVGVVMVFHDVSERADLERALRQQTEQLLTADRRKDEFLAMLSHELRNPLAPLSNGVQLLRLASAEDPTARRVTAMMERQLHHLTRLVNDLLDVARITRGSITLQCKPLSLATSLQLALELARPIIDQQRHVLSVELPPVSLEVLGDVTRLAQVFANLLSNAAKYTPPGGNIWLDWQPFENSVRIRVRDSGVGLPPDLIDHVFDLFQQGTRSLDRSQGGLGVGLTIARALVEMHGGEIRAQSDGVGQGSSFSVTLPVLENSVRGEPMDGAATVPAVPQTGRRVLVVDDNTDAAVSLAFLVEQWGHTVRVAGDGEQALELCRSALPDAVLLDIGLPGMDGYATARALRALAGVRPLLIVAVTGYGRSEDRQLSAEAGFDLHMVKPIDSATLQEVLAVQVV